MYEKKAMARAWAFAWLASTYFIHWSGLNSIWNIFWNICSEGANLSKLKIIIKWKLWKMPKTKQSNLIAKIEMLNIGVINKDTINLGIGEGLFRIS